MADACTIRRLEHRDLPEIANILAEGFPKHSLAFWQDRLRAMAERQPAPTTPQFGYGLDISGLQGVVLTYGSLHGPAEARQTIVNISSWTVRPAFRGFPAHELYRRASTGDMTFSNISPAMHTLKTIQECGFTERTAGQIIAIGVSGFQRGSRQILSLRDAERADLSPDRAAMMHDHQARGCLTFCLEGKDGLAPLVFLPRRLKYGIPVAQLIYCERLTDLTDNSRAITLRLLKRGFLAMLIDTSGPVKGFIGRYFPGKAPKYYKGPMPIYAIDHSYSEMIYIGF